MTNTFNLFIPLTKVDAQKREVWGRATQEILDGHNEIMDYASSVPNFMAWSGEAQKRSQGKSKGNLRSMHQPVAAGKLIAIDFNGAEKAVDIGTYVSDDQEWQKCLDGTYTGFSIGGDYVKRWADPNHPGAVRYTAKPHEISLVDAPAVPTATFELVKADGTSETKKFANVLPIEVEKAEEVMRVVDGQEVVVEKVEGELDKGTAVEELDKSNEAEELDKSHQGAPGIPAKDVEVEAGNTAGAQLPTQDVIEEVLTGEQAMTIPNLETLAPPVDDGRVHEVAPAGVVSKSEVPEWVSTFTDAVKNFNEGVEKMDELRKQEAEKEEQVITVLKSRGSRVGIARREGEPTTAPSGAPVDWMQYADPANWRWALAKREDIPAKILAYNSGAGRSQYSPSEWHILGRRITRLASDISGETYQYNPTLKKVGHSVQEKIMSEQLKKGVDTAGVLRDLGSQLNAACQMIGSDPNAAKDLLMQALAAIDVASDVSVANPSNPASPSDPGSSVDEVQAALATPATPSATSTPAPAVEKVETEPAPSPEMEKLLANQAELTKSIAAMQEILANVLKGQQQQNETLVPIGDLASIVAKPQEETPLLKAMNDGNLGEAFKAVGNDATKLYEQVNDLAVQSLYRSGINVAKYGFVQLEADETPK